MGTLTQQSKGTEIIDSKNDLHGEYYERISSGIESVNNLCKESKLLIKLVSLINREFEDTLIDRHFSMFKIIDPNSLNETELTKYL